MVETGSPYFFRDLQTFNSFEDVTDTAVLSDLPGDWWVVVSDIVGSTKAIESGKYKNVNVVGASIIVAIVNIDRSVEVPFVFGGDGATLAIPPSFEQPARAALLKVKELARDGFQLELRTGMVRARDLQAGGLWLRVGKYRMSESLNQTAFGGRGWEYAEKMLKDPKTRPQVEVVPDGTIAPEANFEGFECRWQGVTTRKDCKMAILVQAIAGEQSADSVKVYAGVWKKIFEVCGRVEDFHPISQDKMRFGLSWRRLKSEVEVRSPGAGKLTKLAYYLRTVLMTLIGSYLMRKGIKTKSTDWGSYKSDFVANCDYKKFDGTLKLVIDASNEQYQKLHTFLEEQFRKGHLVYGIHLSKEALLTCLIFDYHKRHLHFVDGGSGGYAMAAKMMKRQLRERADATESAP